MSDIITVKISFMHVLTAALALLGGGGGVFVAIRRNQQRVRAYPEAIELEVTGAVEGNSVVGTSDDVDASN